MSKQYENNVTGLTAWALDAYKNLNIIVLTVPMDDESRELVQTFLADAPAFFEPTARKYAAQSIVKGLRKIKDLFGP